jgi:hypothetical protein
MTKTGASSGTEKNLSRIKGMQPGRLTRTHQYLPVVTVTRPVM